MRHLGTDHLFMLNLIFCYQCGQDSFRARFMPFIFSNVIDLCFVISYSVGVFLAQQHATK